jgi:hypothetical protein
MKRTVLTFGLISGAILSAMMVATIPFVDRIGFDAGEIVGYTTMVLSFLLVFFGVKSYRDTVNGGQVTFGRAFVVGGLIALVASVCYVITWQILYYGFMPDFFQRYQTHLLDEMRKAGATPDAVDRRRAELASFAALYSNPIVNAAITFLEPLPVALVAALVSAGVLRRRRQAPAGDAGSAAVA